VLSKTPRQRCAGSVTAAVEPLMAMAELPGPYDLRAYKVRARGVTTNT
jgi:carbon-monoxide dehydrogenase large subunit